MKTEKSSFKTKIVNRRNLTSECWHMQVWGLPYCKTCKYLGAKGCGGYKIRKKIIFCAFRIQYLVPVHVPPFSLLSLYPQFPVNSFKDFC